MSAVETNERGKLVPEIKVFRGERSACVYGGVRGGVVKERVLFNLFHLGWKFFNVS